MLRTQILVFLPGAFLETQPTDMLQALLLLMDEQAVGVRCILLEVFLEPFLEPFLELTLAIFFVTNYKPQNLILQLYVYKIHF